MKEEQSPFKKSENISFYFLVVSTGLTKLINYLYPYAESNKWCFYIMNTICRCGVVWIFLFCGIFAAWHKSDLFSVGVRYIIYYFIWGGIYFIFSLVVWYNTGQNTLRKCISWLYGLVMGEPGFIWCLYGIGLSFLIIHFYKENKWIKQMALFLLLGFMFLNIYKKLLFGDRGGVIYNLIIWCFRGTRNPLAYALFFILTGYSIASSQSSLNKVKHVKNWVYLLGTGISLLILTYEITYIYSQTGNFNLHLTIVGTLFAMLSFFYLLKILFIPNILFFEQSEFLSKKQFIVQMIFCSSLITYYAITKIIEKF